MMRFRIANLKPLVVILVVVVVMLLRVVISAERGKGGRRWQVVCLMVVIFVVVGQVQIVFLSVWRMLLLIEWRRPATPQGPLQVQSEVLLDGPHSLLGL